MSRHLPLPSKLAAAAAAVVLAAAALPAVAYPGCSDGTPALTAPSELWAGLQPAAATPFADTSAYNGHQLTDHRFPLWSALDVEGDVLFATYTGGFATYDLSDPRNPKRKGVVDVRSSAVPRPVTWFSELRDFLYFVDAPRGRSDVAVAAGLPQAGLIVLATHNPSNPTATYQDSGGQESGKNFTGVYTAAVGNRLYAFAGAAKGGDGLHAYDLEAALEAGGCGENTETAKQCAGVYQGRIDSRPVSYLGGIDLGGGRHLLATSGGNAAKGLTVWEIVPSASFGYQATQRVSAFADVNILGVAVWTQGTKTYLAVRTSQTAQLYDISSCVGGSCSSLAGKEVGAALKLGFISGWQSATFSRAGNRDSGTPYLYFGNDNKCHAGLKKEWLFDVSNPASPIEISGTNTLEVTASDGHKEIVDYWSYSYSRNPSGFSQVMPRMGKFAGDHFYRAAWTIMEAHVRKNVDPSIDLFGATEGYPNTAQTFTADASNCTPSSTWVWSAGADAAISGSGSSVEIEWSTQGTKTVTATNSGCGNAVGSQVVAIIDPAPAIGDVTVSPASAFVCQPITFTASGVTGQPPLVRSWRVEPTVAGLQQNGDSATWTPGQNDAGTYEGFLTVTGVGTPAEDSATVSVSPLDPLPDAGFTISNAPFAGSKVTFDAAVSGATEWRWSFGDGTTPVWTSDPVAGPRPQHTYSCGGPSCTFVVKVEVRNCVDLTPRASAELTVVIENPLEIRAFAAVCQFGLCGFETGEQVPFSLDVSGDPDEYHFDWDGNGTFEDKRTTSPGSTVHHAYSTAGTYTPVLKVVRGAQASEPFPVSRAVTIVKPSTPPPPPPTKTIKVSGPSSGNVGQALTYSASAAGCTPSSNGWTWNTGGGTGSSATSSITITFGSAGTKSVTASNSGCSGVSGSRSTTISGDTAPTLTASFTHSPAQPTAGEKVSFDGTSSTGGPEFYSWRIGDEVIPGSKIDYTFAEAGSYSVRLEVSKRSASCQLGMCTATVTKTVNVQADGVVEPPPAPVLGNGCAGADADDPSLLCLIDGRFRIRVDWIDHHNAFATGVGRSVRSAATAGTTGFFWFFNQDNIELLVKMLDGTTVNGSFWFFYGGLSDIEYEITVEDTLTGLSKTYRNLPGTIGGFGDAAAFPSTAASGAAASAATSAPSSLPGDVRPQQVTAKVHVGGDDGGNGGNGGDGGEEETDELLLLDGRFQVKVDFVNQHAGDAPGLGRAVVGTNNAGYYWFFTRDNLELVVKMIDARPFDGHFWVFWTGLSDVKYRLKIKDQVTGEEWEFHNPAGKIGGGADTSAFGG